MTAPATASPAPAVATPQVGALKRGRPQPSAPSAEAAPAAPAQSTTSNSQATLAPLIADRARCLDATCLTLTPSLEALMSGIAAVNARAGDASAVEKLHAAARDCLALISAAHLSVGRRSLLASNRERELQLRATFEDSRNETAASVREEIAALEAELVRARQDRIALDRLDRLSRQCNELLSTTESKTRIASIDRASDKLRTEAEGHASREQAVVNDTVALFVALNRALATSKALSPA